MDDPSRNEERYGGDSDDRPWRDLDPDERREAEEIYEGRLTEAKLWQREERERREQERREIATALAATDVQTDPWQWDQDLGRWVDVAERDLRRERRHWTWGAS